MHSETLVLMIALVVSLLVDLNIEEKSWVMGADERA